MSIVNRRNAMIGWATLTMIRRMAAMKARRAASAVPSKDGSKKGGGKGKKALKLGAVAIAVGGAAAFWKAKHRDSTDHDSVASEELATPDE